VQAQRADTVRALQDYTRLKTDVPDRPERAELAWLLVLDNLVFQAEAEIRWLDPCESRLVRAKEAEKPLSRRASARREARR
jgi:hypothetical protein